MQNEAMIHPKMYSYINIRTMKMEPFKTKDPVTFYGRGEPLEPLIKCTEWMMERAMPALKSSGLII